MNIYEGKEKYIFISYAHLDSKRVLPIVEAMDAAGFRVWYDDGIEAGSEWPEYIAEHLIGSDVIIYFITQSSVESQNCAREINYAISKKKRILTVYLEDVVLSPGMDMQLGTLQAIYRNKFDSDEAMTAAIIRAKIIQGTKRDIASSNEMGNAFSGIPLASRGAPATVKTASPAKKGTGKKAVKNDGNVSATYIPISTVLSLDLSPEDKEEVDKDAKTISDTLALFNVEASIVGVERGPQVTRYEIKPSKDVRVKKIIDLSFDFALALCKENVRIEAPIPGKSTIGLEVPNKLRRTVRLFELMDTANFSLRSSKTSVFIGKDVSGNTVVADVSKFPHALVCGATGTGKSVCIHSIIASILTRSSADEVKFILIDPKTVEFRAYNGIPNLLVPVITDAKHAAGALRWVTDEMERRYGILAANGLRNIDAYNEAAASNREMGKPIPKIIIVIDELADLMIQVKEQIEDSIMRIAQKARAAGIHLIIGTQRPSIHVLTPVIKANIPTRIACKVSTYADSRVVLDMAGAERLIGSGDMLYVPTGSPFPIRVQGAFISDAEILEMTEQIKSRSGEAEYDAVIIEAINDTTARLFADSRHSDDDEDPLYAKAVDLAVENGTVSTSMIQRKFLIGYGRAARIIDCMENAGIISGPDGAKPRKVLITRQDLK